MTETGTLGLTLTLAFTVIPFSSNRLRELAYCLQWIAAASAERGKKMEGIKLVETETIETTNLFNFAEGPITVTEREVHEIYRCLEQPAAPRLIVGEAIERTRNFIAKTRAEFAELNSVLRELTAK